MSFDPWQTLGLAPGAGQAEIKRAYRRLAKEHHPDSAGPAALPRFLAIQMAYELLTTGRSGARRSTATAGPDGSASGPGWRADPERARATREAWRQRTRRSTSARSTTAGPESNSRQSQPGDGSSAAAGGRGASAGAPGGGEGRERGGRGASHRRRATPGSTSYDEAQREPRDGQWTGASWYGQSSGTYWTINPREYADPRKHGPEYQARARRVSAVRLDAEDAGGSEALAGEPQAAADPDASEGSSGSDSAAPADSADASPSPEGGGSGHVSANDRPSRRAWSGWPGERRVPQPERVVPPPEWSGAGGMPASRSAAPVVGLGDVVAWIRRAPRRRLDRIILTLAAWPPLGLAAALLLGELTGCARFAASCASTASFTAWSLLAQLAVVTGLLALTPLSRLAAFGSVAVVLAALPIVGVLVAAGATYDPERGPATLLVLLGVAWLVGVGVGWRALRQQA